MIFKKNGFTLVEVLITLTVVVTLAVSMIGIFNTGAVLGKARDASRKKDLNRIRTAFEEYFNDRGYYPNSSFVDFNLLNSKWACGKDFFKPWLSAWPCDPGGDYYKVLVESNQAGPVQKPKWFKVLTQLENKKDASIPIGWNLLGDSYHIGPYSASDVNYGVSSTNVKWNDLMLSPICGDYHDNECSVFDTNTATCPGAVSCSGDQCFASAGCNSLCRVKCCGSTCE